MVKIIDLSAFNVKNGTIVPSFMTTNSKQLMYIDPVRCPKDFPCYFWFSPFLHFIVTALSMPQIKGFSNVLLILLMILLFLWWNMFSARIEASWRRSVPKIYWYSTARMHDACYAVQIYISHKKISLCLLIEKKDDSEPYYLAQRVYHVDILLIRYINDLPYLKSSDSVIV